MKKAETYTIEFFNLGGYKNHLGNPEAKALSISKGMNP